MALENVGASTNLASLTISASYYGTKDLYTDTSGCLYLWLPSAAAVTAAATASASYAGSVTAPGSGTATETLFEVPQVTSASVPAASAYKAGQSLAFTVNFCTGVTVDTAGGKPYLPLTVGSSDVRAVYQSGSGTSALVFGYTLAAGDNGAISLGSAMALNGGTIKNIGGTLDAELMLDGVASTAGVQVDTVAPTVSSITPTASAASVPVSGDIAVTFSEPMSAVAGVVSLTKSGGSPVTLDAANGSLSTEKMTYTFPYTGLDYSTAYTVAVSGFQDSVGNIMATYSSSFTTEAEPLTPSVSSTMLTVNKGGTASINVTLGQGTAAATGASISTDNNSVATVSQSQLSTSGTITVTGLSVGTAQISVTFNDAASTVKTIPVTVQPIAPTWPTSSSLTSSNVTRTGATLNWTAAQDTAAVTGYRLYQNGILIATVAGNVGSQTVTGLSVSTSYTFQVQAGNADSRWTVNGPAVTVITTAASSGGSSSSGKTYQADFSIVGGTSAKLPVSVDTSVGRASVSLGAAQGKTIANGGSIIVTMPSVTGVTRNAMTLPSSALTAEAGGTLALKSDAGNLIVPSNMLKSTGVQGLNETIMVGKGDTASLSSEAKAEIGNRPVIQLTLLVDGTQVEWNNPDAPVTVNIPYTPTAEELKNPESIVIWYIDGSGKLVCVPNGHYDAVNKSVTFETTHFSLYSVGYHPVSFNDVVEGAWYDDAVSFLAARSITSGTSSGNYIPDKTLTRGEFIVMLMRAYGITEDKNPTNSFTDAGNAYYTGYLAAAKRLGISNGVGNNLFAPEKEITRQEMFTLLYHALKTLNQVTEGASGKTLSNFTDSGDVSAWAKDAMELLLKTGAISGCDEKLAPTKTTTRAEMAQVLYHLLRE